MNPLIESLQELQTRRKFYIGTINRNTNAARAYVRRALGYNSFSEDDQKGIVERAAKAVDALQRGNPCDLPDAVAGDVLVMLESLTPLVESRKHVEDEMRKMVRKLPVYGWAKSVHGLGDLGLAVLVAEGGDLGRYADKGKLWSRLGFAGQDGQAHSTWRMKGGLTAEQWAKAGYSPHRHAQVHGVVTDPLFRAQTAANGPYRAIYDHRRATTALTHPDWTKMHSHMDALRVMTKYLLRDLLNAWKAAESLPMAA